MERRRFLEIAAAAGTASMTALAGCAAGWAGRRSADGDARTPTDSVAGIDLPVPDDQLVRAVGPDTIAAIVEPAFAEDWTGLDPDGVSDPTLPDGAPVVGVERDGRARAYPLRVLDWHEIVNDDLGGPIAVTHCVLCGSSVVIERIVDGAETVFGVSGLLWQEALVMYDRATESRWSQLLATAIQGPQTGERLAVVDSTLTSWGEWRAAHPGTVVLLPPPDSVPIARPDRTHPYFRSKYNYEGEDQLIGYDADRPDAVDIRTLVIGVVDGDAARAYPFDAVRQAGVVNDQVGERPVVVVVAPDGTLVAYDRRVGGRTRTFREAGDRHIRAAGSRFERTTGRAVDGPHRGSELVRANEYPPMFWRGWSNAHPETTVYGSVV